MNWAAKEFEKVELGDKRLNSRLVKLCDSLSEAPESPINQACEDWHETKAAYRFFQNQNVDVERIMEAHRAQTVSRANGHETVLAIQDTSYLIYTNHPKTKGLGEISLKKGKNKDKIYSRGLVMHTCLAVSTQGVPLGLLDQKIFARELRSNSRRHSMKGKYVRDLLPVEEKESYRWIQALEVTATALTTTQVVTVCDRECDFYDFFKAAEKSSSSVLVRASQNRTVNRGSRYAQKGVKKLWNQVGEQLVSGRYTVEISALRKARHCKGRTARTAEMEVRFCGFQLNPPRNNPKHKTEKLPSIQMYAIYAQEKVPPEGEKAVEWMLLTNLPIATFQDACQHVHWYSLRWRIEMFFKELKSGFHVESCRLGTAQRLICYLTLMSIIAWRLFMITLVARIDPSLPCTLFLSKPEWTVLTNKIFGKRKPWRNPPNISKAVAFIARLGGYMGRKNDGPPGSLALWRGWKRLMDLTEGWTLANQQ